MGNKYFRGVNPENENRRNTKCVPAVFPGSSPVSVEIVSYSSEPPSLGLEAGSLERSLLELCELELLPFFPLFLLEEPVSLDALELSPLRLELEVD